MLFVPYPATAGNAINIGARIARAQVEDGRG